MNSNTWGRQPAITWMGVARSTYNDFLFSSLASRASLDVIYLKKSLASHPWELATPSYRIHSADDKGCMKLVAAADLLVVSGWTDFRWLLAPLLGARHQKRVFWTDTPDTRMHVGIRGQVRRAVMDYVFRTFDQIWSTGTVGCEALLRLGCPSSKVRAFPFFVDVDRALRLDPTEQKEIANFRLRHRSIASGNEVVFLCVGQLIRRKRFVDAIRALALSPRNTTLWIVGEGEEHERLKHAAVVLGVRNRVRHLGWLQPRDTLLANLAADVLVHPASYDPFPTVVLEAMSVGRPVIGCENAGSVVDRIVDGENGYIHTCGDYRGIASAMRKISESSEHLAALGKEAARTAAASSIELGFKRIQAVLHEPANNEIQFQ
jgi:glycosyltransferase involved in cell wall biosynthesis